MDPTIYRGSQLSMTTSANLFALPPTDVSILSSNYNIIVPSYNFKDSSNALHFQIPPSSSQYMDLRSSFLYLRVKLLNVDGSNLTSEDVVAPSNMFFYTMFKNCAVSVNGTLVSDSNNWYSHQAGIPTLLLTNNSTKESRLSSILYYKDSLPEIFDGTRNQGFKTRLDLAANSKVFDMLGTIPVNLFQLDKYLPTSCAVTVELTRNASEFCLDCATVTKGYKVEIVGAELHIKMHTMNPEIVATHSKEFQTGKAQYQLHDTCIRTAMIPQGTQSFVAPNLGSGKLPTTVIVGLVSVDGNMGRLNKSPFNFQSFGLTCVTVSCDNNPALTRSIKTDFTNNGYLLGYNSLFKLLKRSRDGNAISRADYKQGNVFFVFDLEETFGTEFHLAKSGQLKISLEFNAGISEPVVLFFYAFLEGLMELDEYRSVYIRD